MSRFLRFGVEHALAGTGDQVKEYLVGVDVFDRAKDYDPRVDPIVRVEARRLRQKLRSYYASTGKNDELIIDFPKGAYAAEFHWKSSVKSTVPKPVTSTETSIAVLPFSNLTLGPAPGGDEDYFSDGLTEELILHLTRTKGLRVVAWYSASKFRGREEDLSLIRQQLKVGVVLRGSVRRTESRVRVTVQLIDAATGAVLWADAFERGMRDMVAIQQEIAQSIVATLRPALGATTKPAVSPHKLNPECYNLCLEGRFHANRRNAEALERSALCYQRAIEKDPQSASAHAGLADSYSLLADYGIVHPHQVMPRAESAARRALELDENSAEAFTSLAFIRSTFEWKWTEGEDLYRRAIVLNPSYSKAHHWFGTDVLAILGRVDEAEEEIQIAVRLDPLSLIVHQGIGYVQQLRRDYEASIESYRRLIDMDPMFYKAHASIGRALALMGRLDEAIQSFERALALGGGVPSTVAAMGQVLALAGKEKAARKCLKDLETMARTRYIPSSCFAILHMGLGETSKSLDWLEKSCDQHELSTTSIIFHPLWDPMRREPRFESMMRRVASLP